MDRSKAQLAGGAVVGAVVVFTVGPKVYKGLRQTIESLASISGSKKHNRIQGYNKQHEAASADSRNDDYATLVDSYYDLATEFYEWGWGTSFHFADRRPGETFRQAILRHEYYLAGRLNVNKGATLLDCGCGIGGPARNIARFTEANVKAVTINQFQVDRGNTLSRREGIYGQVELIQGDFMKLPFPDNSFDGVYAIESTCHAPDRVKVYSEILRVLKPGAIFATYEWGLTDNYDAKNPLHEKAKKDIEVGDGLPDIWHTSKITDSLKKSGFEVIEARDAIIDGDKDGSEPWYLPLSPSWNPFAWPRFQFNPIMFRLMPIILRFFELIRLVPKGTKDTQVMLQAGGVGLAYGGERKIFTPAWLMVARKPEKHHGIFGR